MGHVTLITSNALNGVFLAISIKCQVKKQWKRGKEVFFPFCHTTSYSDFL